MLRRVVFVFVLGSFAVAGCAAHEPSSVFQRLGVESYGESIRASYRACPGEVIEELKLWDLDADNIAGEAGDVVVWSASEDELAMLGATGIVPGDSFGPIKLDEDSRYFLEIVTSQGAADPGLILVQDLEPDRIQLDGRTVTMEEFRKNAEKSCE